MDSCRALKLLVVGVRMPPETFIRRRLEGLAARGLSVTVATNSRIPGDDRLRGVRIVRLPRWDDATAMAALLLLRHALILSRTKPARWEQVAGAVWNDFSDLKAAYARLRSFLPLAHETPDVVHFEWNSAAADFHSMLPLWDAPVVVSCRGSDINVRPYAPPSDKFVRDLRASFERADAVHCVSEAIAEEALNFGLTHDKTAVIRPAVDPSFFQPPTSDPPVQDGFQIVSVGSLNWRKGFEYALMALKRLSNEKQPVLLHIVGDGPDRQRLEYSIADLGLEPHVKLHGALSPNDVRSVLQSAHAFLLSSLSEGISNAALEAMACGLPVVTTDCGGMREAVTDSVHGFVVPRRNPDAMAAALSRLIGNSPLRSSIGSQARERVLQDFTLNHQVDAFVRLYRSLLSSPVAA